MFGQTGNPSFGFNAAAQNSPFGQSAFGKTIPTTSFGTTAPPVFGSNTSLFNSKPNGSGPGGLFGNTTTTPTFGSNSATSSSFGGFGNTSTTTPLFGSQQNANTNLFGTTNSTSTFGQTNKPTTFGFGQSTGAGLFGQTQQTIQQSTPFGQSNAPSNTGLFGSTSGFGGTNSVNNMTGTLVKFSPVTGTDTMVKNGTTQTISTRHHCITCMKEYESKSLEELRLEDYTAGRKGAVQGQPSTMFGTLTQGTPFSTVVSNSTNSGFGTMAPSFGHTSQNNSTSLFSKPLTGFGVPSTTSSAFAFNATTSSNLFSNQSKPFGITTSTPLFAASNTTSSVNSGFGNINTQNSGFGSSFNPGQSNQSIGLFTQNKPAFNMPPSTSVTNFGFGQPSATNTTTSLFGSKPIGTGFGSTFGGGTTSTFQTGSTGFGTPQNTNTTLFNTTFKVPSQSSGFTFGNTPSGVSTVLGNPGSSLFTSTAKPNLFGSNNSSTTFNTTGAFGSVPTFGSGTNQLSTLGTNFFGAGLLVNNLQQSSNLVPVHQQILALVSAPFGDSPLLKNLLPASGKSEQFLKPANTISKSSNNLHYKILTSTNSSKPKLKIVPSIALSKKSLFDGLDEEDPLLEAFQPRPNAKRLVLRPKLNMFNQDNPKELGTKIQPVSRDETSFKIADKENEIQDNNKHINDSRLSNSWLKSNFPSKSKISDQQKIEQPLAVTRKSELLKEDNELDNTVTELRSPVFLEISKDVSNTFIEESKDLGNTNDYVNIELDSNDSKSPSEQEEENLVNQQKNEIKNCANLKLQRHGYYIIPSLESLNKYVKNKTCIVPHFTIGRKGYGNVYFADSFDIYGLNLDEIVHFRHKEVIIYPDDKIKPPIGKGLNRKAQVTLDRVWPHDKSSHEPITDPKRLIDMDYEGKLRKVSAKHDTKFLEYRPETGSWVFKVDHFSKYGLSDSDEDESVSNNEQDSFKNKDKIQNLSENFTNDNLSQIIRYQESHTEISNENDSYDINLQQIKCNRLNGNQSFCSPTSVHARLTGCESHKLQLMKASFFEWNKGNVIDGVQKGNVFKSSWSSKLSFVSIYTPQQAEKMYPYYTMRQPEFSNADCLIEKVSFTNLLQHVRILGENIVSNDDSLAVKASIENHLNIQLQYSKIDKDKCNLAIVSLDRSTNLEALHAHKNEAIKEVNEANKNSILINYIGDVWKLCESLWGRSLDLENISNSSHELAMQRKEALSDWLKSITAQIIQHDLAVNEKNDQIIFSLLSANQLEEACKLALENGDHCLALLLSQMGGTLTVRELIKQQIELWHDTNVDENLSVDRLKLFMLIAGLPTFSRQNKTIDVYGGLDWKRTFAIYLWYISKPTASITDTLDLYDASCSSMPDTYISPRPWPDYYKEEYQTDITSNQFLYDLSYHLLKLYCNGNHSLEIILNPQTYTCDPFDYRLSWLLQQTLSGLGYLHLSEYATYLTHANFAAQLESLNLWHWSVFVVLHFTDSKMRHKAVYDLLSRHVDIDDSPNYIHQENFLKNRLKIPIKWINYAKAIKSCSKKRFNEAAWYFIYAEEWNSAHDVIMEHLATEAIINDNYGYLKTLLSLLMPPNSCRLISGWLTQGQIIMDYIIITAEIKHLLSNEACSNMSYTLEQLQPQLISLCSKINAFPCPTVKHRLCQAEMSKRTLQLARSLCMIKHNEKDASSFLIHLISQLPFPEDYAQQELRPIINFCVNNTIA
ncbi:nuclear pore complex protein Nup98-Nup96 isoform X2 [Nasonia vitripennis]|uniref:Nuclear pore complex protein Nup98-Nup96 n=1 Tax=Nasonia vitripennis TaxID=7425 RepID=A0A7M7R5F1_NASVI|nr:nuclear pore complex protein Nup98-Nup96 isoform X2 [Nasonia vitripennis]